MNDTGQIRYFNFEENRYKEELLFHPPKHTRDETNIIIHELKKRNISKVVDFGSGNGRLTVPLLQNNIQVTAVDSSNESLRSLWDISLRMKVKKGLLSVSTTIQDDKSDAIVGCDILHHVHLDTYLYRMNKKLAKSKGIIVFSEPNILNIFWPLFITFFINWSIEKRILYCNYFTLMAKLKKNNFENIHISGLGLFPLPLFNKAPLLEKINYFLGTVPILKFFAYRFIIIAESR